MPPAIDARRLLALAMLLLSVVAAWVTVRADAGSAAPAAAALRFPCLSYAPFRMAGTSPNDKGLIIPADAIARDLAQLATVTGCVRVYGVANGLDAVPSIARTLGLRVWLGAWIGSDERLNRIELERALALAAEHADIVERLVVGSETLLRGELPPAALAGLLDAARARSPVPVAYADVWEFWLRHAATLQPHVDQAVIHILPYWEDEPVAIGQAVDHVVATFGRVGERLAPLPVVIGETGWPAAGRMRAGARAGVREQQRFLHELMQRQPAAPSPLPINIIEAYDQPWKASLEGVAGAAWGVFDAQGRTRDAAAAGRTAPAAWLMGGALAMACALWSALWLARWMALLLPSLQPGLLPGLPTRMRVLTTAATAARSGPGWRGMLAAACAGATLGALCLTQWQALSLLAPDSWAGVSRMAVLAASTAWAVAEALALALALDGARPPMPAGPLLRRLRSAGLLAVTAYALALLADGRYLDLAWPALAAPALPLALHALVAGRDPGRSVVRVGAAALLAACAVAIVLQEGVVNAAAVVLALLMLVLSACLLPAGQRIERVAAEAA